MVRVGSEPFLRQRHRQQEVYAGVHPMRRQRVLIGLLIAAIFIGSFGVALRSPFLTGAQEKPAIAKFQDRLVAAAEPATAKSISVPTSDQSNSKPLASVAEVEAFSVNNIRPTKGFATVSATASMTPQESPAKASPTSQPSQSRIAVEPHRVLLPKRKPKTPITKEVKSTTTKQKPTEQEQAVQTPKPQMPKPMAFGNIGYNYNPQQ